MRSILVFDTAILRTDSVSISDHTQSIKSILQSICAWYAQPMASVKTTDGADSNGVVSVFENEPPGTYIGTLLYLQSTRTFLVLNALCFC